jgi:hypothetical protein
VRSGSASQAVENAIPEAATVLTVRDIALPVGAPCRARIRAAA